MTDTILNRSETLRRDFFERQQDLLQELATEGQHPDALFVTCSDSRVTPGSLLGASPGDLFMLRNIANIIPPYIQTEIGIASVLEYAVLHLQVPHVIICGHTDCGGIKGLDVQLDMSKEPALTRWLDLARPAQRHIDSQLAELTPQARHEAIVERNVVLQLHNLSSYPYVREALESDRLELHGWVYYLESQQIKYYDIDGDQFRTP